jgi:threonine dehydrogenase-like Zn-dependent dehydrogenase
MRAVVLEGGKVQLKEVSIPQRQKNEALIKVLLTGICRTDLELCRGYMQYEGTLGHEFVGVVVDADNSPLIDKRVVGEINIGCQKCEWCLNGLARHCPQRTVLGIENKAGTMAEYITLPVTNLHVLDNTISDEEAVFTEPLAAAFEVFEQVQIDSNSSVLIIGDGKLAQLLARTIHLYTKQLLVIGKYIDKLNLLTKYNIETALIERFKPKSYPIVVDATGTENGFNLALQNVQPRGKLIVKSTIADNIDLNLTPVVINEIEIIGSRCGPFPPALEALLKKKVSVVDLITKIYPGSEAIQAFAHAQKKNVLKILLNMTH